MSESFINDHKMSREQKITGLKELFKQFLPLLVAIILQQILALFVNLLDNFMLGRYMESAMSAATVANQVHSVLGNLVFGAGAGIAVLGAQYWGKGQTTPIKRIISCGLRVSVIIGIIFTVSTYFFPRQILSLLTDKQIILDQALDYMSIMCWTFVIYSISNVLMVSLQAVETAFVGTIMSASTIVINFTLNYILIYGNFGAPELGIKGAAYATLTSRSVELIIVVVYLLFIDKKLKIKLSDIFKAKTGFFKDYISSSWPMMYTGAMWGLGLAAQTAILGHLSEAVIGASSVAVTVAQVFLVTSYASASASGVVMGKVVGGGHMEMVKPFARALQLFFAGLGILTGLLIVILRYPIVGFYDISPETRSYALSFMLVMGISSVGSVYEYPVMAGIIAGGGNTKYQAIIDFSFMWLFTIPVSALSAFVFNWPPIVTFFFLKIDQVLKCIPNAIYCNTFKWVKNRTRDVDLS